MKGKETVSTEERNGIWLGLGIWKLRMGVKRRRYALGKTGREWYAHTLEKYGNTKIDSNISEQ